MTRNTPFLTRNTPFLAGLVGLTLLAFTGQAAKAQTFSLTPSATTAQVGDTLVFTVMLNPASGGSNNLFAYDTNLSLSSTYLQFAETATGSGVYYTPSSATTTKFPTAESTSNKVSASGGSSVLRLTYDNNFSDASFASQTALGTFKVKVLSALPVGGTQVLFGPAYSGPSSTATNGGSELLANYGDEVLQGVSGATISPLASAPEPSAWVSLGVGAVLLGTAGWRARRRSTQLVQIPTKYSL